MKLSALLQPLIDAKVPHEIIMQQILAYEAQQEGALERRRQADADRQSRKRDRDKSRDITLRHSDRFLTGAGDAPVEDKTSNLEIEPQKVEKTDAPVRDVAEFKAEFPDLDAERLNALLKHRRSKHGQITGHSARLFRKDATAAGLSIADAVDTCISRNWITVKADWLNKPQARGSPPQRPETTTDVAQRLLAEMRSANGQPGTSPERNHQALVAIPGGKYAGHGG